MALQEEEQKAGLIKKVATRIKAGKGASKLGDFARGFFAQGAAEDLLLYEPDELAAIAADAWKTLSAHTPGSHAVRIVNPDFGKVGETHRATTIVELVNDNMPFLVQSVLGEIREAGLDVRLVLHPIFVLTGKKKGTWTGVRPDDGDAPDSAPRVSCIQIHVKRVHSDQVRASLEANLNSLLEAIRVSVEDWGGMRQRLAESIARFRYSPPPVQAAELAEAIQFLEWLDDDNFTFLGMREYTFSGGAKSGKLQRGDAPGLGLLRDPAVRVLRRGSEMVTITPEVREFLMRPEPLFISKANVKSRIHRRVHMDYIGVKLYNDKGKLRGELRIIGLFTATAYTRSAKTIPFVRQKVDRIMQRAAFDPESHSGKALENVLESYPRDEFFQVDDDTLYDFSMAILRLNERPRVRVLPRRDRFDRFVSILTFVPREKFFTSVRVRIADLLKTIYDGRLSAWYVTFLEGNLVRVHFIIGRDSGQTPNPDRADIESEVQRIISTWEDGLQDLLDREKPAEAMALFSRYGQAFNAAYREQYNAESALADMDHLENLSPDAPTSIGMYRRPEDAPDTTALKVFNLRRPIPLSSRVPILENMGFRVINERTYKVEPQSEDGQRFYLHDMTLVRADGEAVDLDEARQRIVDLFMAVWRQQAENDGFNALAIKAGIAWRDIAIIRALARYLRQVRIPYSQDYMWGTLSRFPHIAATLAELFRDRFDPDFTGDRDVRSEALRQDIETELEAVSSLDDDRIIRRFTNLILGILRTNVFQTGEGGDPVATFAFKLDPGQINDLPEPRPYREIFVYSPRVEGVHLRFGTVARGGLRWSDRAQDFRTEVLGLVKAQQVKNAVIVPVGAKGGFYPKAMPANPSREEFIAEGTATYKLFINNLLSVTDNLEGDKIIPPRQVIRYDGDDPYLVVAADKGTATFSDTANGIAEENGFWLGDAFASGGSAGYDHKKMGITARGAWEAVKRHFREMDRDIQTEPFTAAGVGDMSGDVFGNGMLLSPATKLVAAFDHRDIFFDPDPDPESSFKERQRLFDLGRSSWQDYNTKLISKGGGIFSRSQKSIALSQEMQTFLGLKKAKATPFEIMTAILKADIDLLWFGGIGTYIRATTETDADAGDKANDPIRITAPEVGAKVVGEGANLGLTQKARIEYNMHGGRSNSDAIDNSAGVNSSDVEVNIKIALGAAERAGKLTRKRRNTLLASMTDSVADLVLRNNYQQTLSISLCQRRGMEDFGYQRRMMQRLEAADLLDREVEDLPDDAALHDREAAGQPLVRAELGVLLAYAKITLYDDLLASDVPDDPYFAEELLRYFPPRMLKSYRSEIEAHRLRREIIATVVANSLVNRGGPTILTRISDQTGADSAEIARSFVAVRAAYGLRDLWDGINALDTKIKGAVQLSLYAAIEDFILDEVVWFLRNVSFVNGIAAVVARFQEGLTKLRNSAEDVIPEAMRQEIDRSVAAWVHEGVPEGLARSVAALPVLAMIPNVILISEATGKSLQASAAMYFTATAHFRIGALDGCARALRPNDYYDALALDRARQALAQAHRAIAASSLEQKGNGNGFDIWRRANEADVSRAVQLISSVVEAPDVSVSKIAVAANVLSDLTVGT
ncbi:MAG: NAD-glutamate dehydrogenase [Pseudomonadota bacterium]